MTCHSASHGVIRIHAELGLAERALTNERVQQDDGGMRDISPVLLSAAHHWAWLLRTGLMEREETLEPNSAVIVWFSDAVVKRPPADVDAALDARLFYKLANVPAATVQALWREPKDRHLLMRLFAASLEHGPPMTEEPPADLIVHLVDTLLPAGRRGFEIRLHCSLGTYLSVTTLAPDTESQVTLAPDAAVRVDDDLSIDKFLHPRN